MGDSKTDTSQYEAVKELGTAESQASSTFEGLGAEEIKTLRKQREL